MDYADFNATKASKKKLTALVIVLALAIALTLLTKVVLEPKYEELKVSLESTSALARQITSAETEKDGYEQTLEDSGKVFGNLVSDKESYISFIGETTLANQLKVNKMTVDDIVPAGSQLYAMKISLEVQGSLYNVKNLIQNLYDSEVVSRINSFSYRLQSVDKDGNQLQWMWPLTRKSTTPSCTSTMKTSYHGGLSQKRTTVPQQATKRNHRLVRTTFLSTEQRFAISKLSFSEREAEIWL